MLRLLPALDNVPTEDVATRARAGNQRARRELLERLLPTAFRVAVAVTGDAERGEQSARDAFDATLSDTERPFAEALLRRARSAAVASSRDAPVPGMDGLDEVSRTVLVLVDLEGRSLARVARTLGMGIEEVTLAHARARTFLGEELRPTRCVGWALVSRQRHLDEVELQAADGHVEICVECREALAARNRAKALLLARIPDLGTVVRGATLGASILGIARRTSVAAGIGTATAVVVGTLVLGGGGGGPEAGDSEVDGTTAPALPDAGPDASDAGRPGGGDGRPAAPGEDAPGESGQERGENAAGGAVTGASGPAGPGTDDDPVAGTLGGTPAARAEQPTGSSTPTAAAPAPPAPTVLPARSLVVTAVDVVAPGNGRVRDHLEGLGHDAAALPSSEATTRQALGAALAAVRPGTVAPAVVHLSLPVAEGTSLVSGPAYDLADGAVAAADLAAALPDVPGLVVVLDLHGASGVDLDAHANAFAAAGRVVVAGQEPTSGVVAPDGTSSLSAAVWDEALIGGAGDADGDGRVSVEEAHGHAAEFAFRRGVLSRPVLRDGTAEATHLDGSA